MRFCFAKGRLHAEVHTVGRKSKTTSGKTIATLRQRRIHMQQSSLQQEQHSCFLHDDKQQFIEEISVLQSLAAEAGIAANLLAELEVFEHEVEHLDSSSWEQHEVRVLKRHDLVHLSLAVLRAYNAGSRDAFDAD
jgi:hypothetical protein